jgi:hypothetical protein
VFNENGHLVTSTIVNRSAGGVALEKIPVDKLSSGIYFVDVRSDENNFRKKITISK